MSTRDDPAEVLRALQYRAQERRRAAFQRQNLLLLAGSRTARAALADAWASVARRRDARYPEQSPVIDGPAPQKREG